MKVEVKDLRDHPVELTVDCSPESLELQEPSYRFPEKVRGTVAFSLVGDQVLARGRVDTEIESDCVKCLKTIRTTVRAPIDVIYEKKIDPLTPEQEVFGVGDVDERIAFFDGDTIRPEQQLREAIMLELPALPVCDMACKGLCPKCGADLNEGPCGCDTKVKEVPAWKSALKNLKLEP